MNGEIDKTNQIIELFKEAENIAIIPSKVAGIDAFSAAAGLYFLLKEQNKNATIIYPGVAPEDFGDTSGVDITNNAGKRELLVSVDYSGTNASKVNYSTENDILYFSISPIDRDFDVSRVSTEIKGSSYDLIITIGAQIPEDLGKAFNDIVGDYAKPDVLNIDNTDKNQRFGTINVVDSKSDSLSLLMLNKLVSWGLRVNNSSAEALLKGISRRKGI